MNDAEPTAKMKAAGADLEATLIPLGMDVERIERAAADGGADAMDPGDLADAVALLQDLRARILLVERDLTTALGERLGKTVGELSDGRQFTLERNRDRKEWDHDDWQRDVRRAITTDLAGARKVIDMDTGEETPLAAVLQDALARAQAIHGSTAPRSRSLTALGLYASDYCTTQPAGWRFAAVKPTTTTEEK